MATSGTTTFDMNLTELVEEAFERAGGQMRTGYDLRTARRSLNLMFADWANRGINLWTVEQGVINLVAGTQTYDLPDDTVDLIEHQLRRNPGNPTTQADITLSRISVSTWAAIPNKLSQGYPIQIYINRQTPTPNVTLWPIPDNNGPYQLVYWRLRRIEDAGSGVNTMDVPFRFLPVMAAGLAYFLAMKIPEGVARRDILKQDYEEAWAAASDEDRDRAALRFVPRMMRVY